MRSEFYVCFHKLGRLQKPASLTFFSANSIDSLAKQLQLQV